MGAGDRAENGDKHGEDRASRDRVTQKCNSDVSTGELLKVKLNFANCGGLAMSTSKLRSTPASSGAAKRRSVALTALPFASRKTMWIAMSFTAEDFPLRTAPGI